MVSIGIADATHIPQMIEVWKGLMAHHIPLDPIFQDTRQDAPAIWEKYMREHMASSDGIVLVALDGEEVVGFLMAQIAEIRRLRLTERSARLGRMLVERLGSFRAPHSAFHISARGLGLMAGLELRHADGSPATKLVLEAIKQMLRRGFILLPEGEHSNVIGFTPPLTIVERDLDHALAALAETLRELVSA